MNAKKCLALLLSACMAASVLAGCKDGDRKPSSSSSTNSSTNSSTTGNIVWSDPDYYKADDGQDNDKGCKPSKPKTYKVAVEVRGGAYTIDKKTPIEVKRGENVEFTVTAEEGYYIQSVKIGDTEVIPNDEAKHSSYIVKMEKLCSNRTVTITLGVLTYGIQTTLYGPSEIAAAASVTPSNYTPKYGEEVTFTLKYTDDYALQKVEVVANGETKEVEVNKNNTFTYKVCSDVIVNAYFEEVVEEVPTIVKGSITGSLIKKNYVVGDELDPNGLQAVLTYSDDEVVNVALIKDLIQPIKIDDNTIRHDSKGYFIQITLTDAYENMPINYYFNDGDFTISTVDKNGNGESKYLTQREFDAINKHLKEIANDNGAAVGTNQGIRSDLLEGDTSRVSLSVSIEGNYKNADEIINRINQFASNIRDLGRDLGPKEGVTVYMNIQDASVAGKIQLSLWAVVEKT